MEIVTDTLRESLRLLQERAAKHLVESGKALEEQVLLLAGTA